MNGRGGRAFLGEGLILAGVVLHFVLAADVENTVSSLTQAEDRFVVTRRSAESGSRSTCWRSR